MQRFPRLKLAGSAGGEPRTRRESSDGKPSCVPNAPLGLQLLFKASIQTGGTPDALLDGLGTRHDGKQSKTTTLSIKGVGSDWSGSVGTSVSATLGTIMLTSISDVGSKQRRVILCLSTNN